MQFLFCMFVVMCVICSLDLVALNLALLKASFRYFSSEAVQSQEFISVDNRGIFFMKAC